MRFAIIGAGMAGMLSAIKLREAGFDHVTVFEKADRVGGTWRENSYPGLACDVPSHLYSYSFRLNPDWSRLFSPGDEIQRYFEQVAKEYDLEGSIRFGDAITSCEFSDGHWTLGTESGFTSEADVVIAATGVLHHAKYPDIDGLDDFEGEVFHSAHWNHDVDLAQKRVGIIGTGSTAVQITTAVVEEVERLDLFQRTAQWVLQMDNPLYSSDEKQAYHDNPASLAAAHRGLSKSFAEGFANAVVDADSPQMKAIAEACAANLDDNVSDPELRERLRPDYQAACKRLVVSPNFYEAIQHENANLVTNDIQCFEPGGVRTVDGELHELDVLVLATGFKVDSFLRPMSVVGRDGHTLAEAWADRPIAYLSISIPEFPNLFMLNGPNGPVGNFSLIEVAELQYDYIAQLIDMLATGEAKEISATARATETFETERVEAAKSTVWVTGCRSWYLDDRGIPAAWPWRFDRFRDEMSAPKLDAYDVRS